MPSISASTSWSRFTPARTKASRSTAAVPGSPAGCPHGAHLMSVASTWACLVAEVAQQHAGAPSDPEGRSPRGRAAELQRGDHWQKLIDDSLAARSYSRQCLTAVTALAHTSSPARTRRDSQEREVPGQQPRARPARIVCCYA